MARKDKEPPTPEEASPEGETDSGGPRQPTVLRNWRQRMARLRLSAGSRPTVRAFSNVEESAQRIREAIRNIPDETDRAILILRIFNGLSSEEVAAKLGLDVDELGKRYRRSLSHLHEELGDWLRKRR
jgi:DNA-directed RNA polymerase specialized sigma24 family protein